MKNIMLRIKEGSQGVIDMGIQSNNYGQNTLSFVDQNQLNKVALEKMDQDTGNSSDGIPEFLKKLVI